MPSVSSVEDALSRVDRVTERLTALANGKSPEGFGFNGDPWTKLLPVAQVNRDVAAAFRYTYIGDPTGAVIHAVDRADRQLLAMTFHSSTYMRTAQFGGGSRRADNFLFAANDIYTGIGQKIVDSARLVEEGNSPTEPGYLVLLQAYLPVVEGIVELADRFNRESTFGIERIDLTQVLGGAETTAPTAADGDLGTEAGKGNVAR